MNPTHQKLHTGDILITETGIPFIQHFGVVVIEGNVTCVYHCTPERNVTMDTITEFLKSRELRMVRKTNATSHSIYKRLKGLKESKYHAVNFNCIHFAEKLTEG